MVLLLLVASATVVGCAGREGGIEVDEGKTQLNVGYFNGGHGREWLDAAVKEFETLYENYEFEPGTNKKGVQVLVDARKEEFKPTNLYTTMTTYENCMYICYQADYELFLQNDLLVDMTTTVNADVYDEDGNLAFVTGKEAKKSILDVMIPEYDKLVNKNGKYYAIPDSYQIGGLIYDADLFDEESYYFTADGQIGANQADIDAGNCGVGPDGVLGTIDDGMPETYAQFLALMTKLSSNGIPMTWSGNTTYQSLYVYQQMWANYEGADAYKINYTFNGTLRDGTTVTVENAATTLANQYGRKAGIQLFKDIGSNKWYSEKAKDQTYDEAQREFVNSLNFEDQNKRIALFAEGGYWESEVRGTLDGMANTTGNPDFGYGKRDFRRFPMPNMVGVNGIPDQAVTDDGEVLIANGGGSLAWFTDKGTTKNLDVQLKVAEKFLQFLHCREQLANFTKNTGACFKAYNFTATEQEMATWTKYTQNVFAYMQQGDVIHQSAIACQKRKDNVTDVVHSFNYFDGSVYSPAQTFIASPNASVESVYASVVEKVKTSLTK